MVVKGSPSRLISAIVDDTLTRDDPNFVRDFLLTFRTFERPRELAFSLHKFSQVSKHSFETYSTNADDDD